MGQAATAQPRTGSRPRGGRHAAQGKAKGAPPRLHLGRLALLALVLIGASFYVTPLREFFDQQDRYTSEAAALQAARTDNAAYKHEIKLLTTKAYVVQRARADSMLVPPDTQVFVVKGLPGRAAEADTTIGTKPRQSSFSVLDRIGDLWQTLLH